MKKRLIVNSFLVFLSILGTISVLSRELTFGVALHWDSVNYIAIARNLLEGKGLIQATWFPPHLTSWPPLYPLLLSAVAFPSLDPYDVAGPVNAVIFGLTIFISGKWLWYSLESNFLRLWGCLTIALSIPMAWMAASAMSESLFILLMIISLINVDSFFRKRQTSFLIWAAIFASLACMTRYSGVTIIATTLMLLAFQPDLVAIRRVKQIVVYVSISSLPLLLWVYRNLMLGVPPFGPRPSDPVDLLTVLSAMMTVFWEWMVPSLPLRNHLSYSESLSALLVFGIFLLALMTSLAYFTIVRTRKRAQVWYRWSPFIVFGTFLLVQLTIFPLSMSGTGHGVQTRFLIPLYIPLVAILAFAADRGAYHLKVKGTLSLAASILFVLYFSHQISLNMQSIIRTNVVGTPYTFSGPRWRSSAVLEYVSDKQKGREMFSPTVLPIYIYTDGSANGYTNIYGEEEIYRALNRSVKGDYFIFFHKTSCNCNFNNVRFSPKLRLLVELSDGIIFEKIGETNFITEDVIDSAPD